MQLNETAYIPFATEDSTGAPATPSVGPAFILRRNGIILTGSTDVVIIGSAGSYQAAFTPSSINGWANGDNFSIRITATVGGIAIESALAVGFVRPAYSTHTAADVWAANNRILTSYGTLVADIVAGVWGNGQRTLTSIMDSAGVTTLLALLTPERVAKIDNADVPTSSRSYHSALDVWLVSKNAAFTINSIGAWIRDFFNNLGSDKRALISADAHDSGVVVADVTNKEGFAPTTDDLAGVVDNSLAENEGLQRIALVPGGAEIPIFMLPDNAIPAGTVPLVVNVQNFGVMVSGAEVTVSFVASFPLKVSGVYELKRVQTKRTVNGVAVFPVYPSSLLELSGASSKLVRVEVPEANLNKTYEIPDDGLTI